MLLLHGRSTQNANEVIIFQLLQILLQVQTLINSLGVLHLILHIFESIAMTSRIQLYVIYSMTALSLVYKTVLF